MTSCLRHWLSFSSMSNTNNLYFLVKKGDAKWQIQT